MNTSSPKSSRDNYPSCGKRVVRSEKDKNFSKALGLTHSPVAFTQVKAIIRKAVGMTMPIVAHGNTTVEAMMKRYFPQCLKQLQKSLPDFFCDPDSLRYLQSYVKKQLSNNVFRAKRRLHGETDDVDDGEYMPEETSDESGGSSESDEEERAKKTPVKTEKNSQRTSPRTLTNGSQSPDNSPSPRGSMTPAPQDQAHNDSIEYFLEEKCSPSLLNLAPKFRLAGVKGQTEVNIMKEWGKERVGTFLRGGLIELGEGKEGEGIVKDLFTEMVFLVALGL